jgi:hypothetical protein
MVRAERLRLEMLDSMDMSVCETSSVCKDE